MPQQTLAEAMSRYNQQKLERAQKLSLPCQHCGNTIEMFCCGETFPLSTESRLKLSASLDAEPLS